MTPLNKPSHLSDASAHGKKYPWKGVCEFCYVPYDIDLSDSMSPEAYCSLPCELNDEYLTENAKKST